MSSTEKLHFKVGLSGTYWKKVPIYSVLVNDLIIFTKNKITNPTDEVEYIEFDAEVAEGTATLHIRLENKDWTDTVQNDDKTKILKDMMLNIVSIEIDDISLGNLVYTKSIFVGDHRDRPDLDKCVNLGWNGTWTLEFTSPFYIWLLENI
jgi:hypothetical protein